MRFATYSLHKFEELDNTGFSPSEYSRFKYGSIRAAEIMGIDLAHSFFKHYAPLKNILLSKKQIVIFPSPFYHIPSAAALMTKYFVIEFNKLLVCAGATPAIVSHIMRELTYHDDYGKMNATQRGNLIAGDKFYVDHNYLKDKHSIHVDDIRITGSHEKEIDKLLGHTTTDYTCIYYAEDRKADPKTEDYLNNYNMKIPKDLFFLMSNEPCVFNVRNMRVLLTMPQEAFIDYIAFTSQRTLNELYNLALGNCYHLVPKYSENIRILKNSLKT